MASVRRPATETVGPPRTPHDPSKDLAAWHLNARTFAGKEAPGLTSPREVVLRSWLAWSLRPDHVLLETLVRARPLWDTETSLRFAALASRVERLSEAAG